MKRLLASALACVLVALNAGCPGPNSTTDPSPNGGEADEAARAQQDMRNKSSQPSTIGSTDPMDYFDPVDFTAYAGDDRFNILSWNVESEGNSPEVIARQLQGFKGYSIIALQEVLGKSSGDRYTSAMKEMWGQAEGYLSKSGRQDSLLFIVDPQVFEVIKVEELDDINPDMKYRSPHVLTLKHRPSETVFLLMNNHLARGNENNRRIQCEKLVEWARAQTLPVVAVGDYNLDYVWATDRGNREFPVFMADGVWKWIKPDLPVDSNWYDGNGDGLDDYPGSILDFAFVAQSAKEWTCTSQVLKWPGDFPDDQKTADHRPVELNVSFVLR